MKKPTFTKEDVEKAAKTLEEQGIWDSKYGFAYPSDGWKSLVKTVLNAVGRVEE